MSLSRTIDLSKSGSRRASCSVRRRAQAAAAARIATDTHVETVVTKGPFARLTPPQDCNILHKNILLATHMTDRELKKGSAELLILSLIEERARHGYDI